MRKSERAFFLAACLEGRVRGLWIFGVSVVPNLDGWSSKLTCYPRVVGPAHDAVCNLEEQKGTE